MLEDLCDCWKTTVNTNLQGKIVYKDECSKCFHSPKDEGGLWVCLSTYQSHCAKHLQLHRQQNPDHRVFMNLTMEKQEYDPQAEKARQEEITKIAIGKPGGFDAE
jgi:ubiquitin carboxyl-terminal hydrolase 5/13